MGGSDGLPGPTDAWVTLAGLARETSRLRLGTLVTSATFRLPGPLAISVAEIDQMSGGRVELGLGAGWYEAEHRAYAVPFPPLGERFEQLEEQLAIITGLWTTPVGERFSFAGRHYQVEDSPGPKPISSPGRPSSSAGTGPRPGSRRPTPTSSTSRSPLEEFTERCARVRGVRGHRPRSTSLTYSAALVICCGADEGEFERRAAAIGQEPPSCARTAPPARSTR